jgi:hypothetical protein
VSDERLIRLENLRRLCAERGLTPQSLSDRIGSRYSYWRDLLVGQKSFGEKAARRIEEDLDLPRGWLDSVHDKGELASDTNAPVVAWAMKDEDECWSCFWIQWDEDEKDPFRRFDPIPGATLLVRKNDIAALERDAARYRWIRANGYVEARCGSPRTPDWRPEHLDAAIDAEMEES